MLSPPRTEEGGEHARRDRRAGGAAPPVGGSTAASGITTAILLATAPADDGGVAAGLAWEDGTVLARLLEQLGDLGLRTVHVVTRPAWEQGLLGAVDGAGPVVHVESSPDIAGDLRRIGDIAERTTGGLVVAYADMVTHREALAGLLADPRIATGILTGARRRPLTFRVRTARGRVVSAGSAHHFAHGANATFLGVLKVSPADRPALAATARELERLVADGLPPAWEQELLHKAERWRAATGEAAEPADDSAEDALVPFEPGADPEGGQDAARGAPSEDEIGRRLAVVREDVTSLLVVGLVRSGAHLTAGYLRLLFWARPVSDVAVEEAAQELAGYDEDRVLLDSAVKGRDGFFTTFLVSPYSKYLARWAAHRGLTPNQITTLSLFIGLLAAGAFATGDRIGLVVGAVLVQLSFTTDCVDGQLARYTRQFSKLGAWLDSVFDRSKEYAVFAGLAIGASRAGDPVWALAGAALVLQITRHMLDFSFAAAQHQVIGAAVQPPLEQPSGRVGDTVAVSTAGAAPAPARAADERPPEPAPEPRQPLLRRLPGAALRSWRRFDRVPALPWVKRMIAFPIGERFAAISITAAVASPRTTFVVLLAWGGLATAYTLAGRLLRSMLPMAANAASLLSSDRAGALATYRDDGPLARALGASLGRRLALSGAVLALIGALPVLVAALAVGADAPVGVAAAVVGWFVVFAGLSAGRPHTGRLRWSAPPAVRAGEYTALVWIGAIAGAPALPAAFALLCALAFRHYDLIYRLRHRSVTPPAWVDAVGLGWDGRVVAATVLLAVGALPEGFVAAAAVLAVVFVTESVVGWVRFANGRRRSDADAYEDEEDEGQ